MKFKDATIGRVSQARRSAKVVLIVGKASIHYDYEEWGHRPTQISAGVVGKLRK